MGENLELLKELTATLPPFPAGEIFPNYSKYKMEKGTVMSWHLFDRGDKVAVDKWFASKDTVFSNHIHHAKEIIVIYEGKMTLYIGDKTTYLATGDVICIDPNQLHSSTIPEDCWFITITIPPAKEFIYDRAKN